MGGRQYGASEDIETLESKTILRLADLEQSKNAVLHSLGAASSQESYGHAIDEFIGWYCSEPRLSFNRTVVLRYRFFLEQQNLAPSTINARLCHLAGGELEQIQFLLGHASVQTTERYLGCKQRLSQAVNDNLGLETPNRWQRPRSRLLPSLLIVVQFRIAHYPGLSASIHTSRLARSDLKHAAPERDDDYMGPIVGLKSIHQILDVKVNRGSEIDR